MADGNLRTYDHVQFFGAGRCGRRWTPEEEIRMLDANFLPGHIGCI